MDDKLRKLAEGPLLNAAKINADPLNLNEGKPMPRPRETRPATEPRYGDLTPAQIRERKEKAQGQKVSLLFDYYAKTSLPAETVAKHMGLYRQVQTGVDKETGKPIYERQLDVERATSELAWRRQG